MGLCAALAGCNPSGASLTPQQQALLTDLEALGVRAACLKVEQQYAKVGRPSAIQEQLMASVRVACLDPYTTLATFSERAAILIPYLSK